MRASWVALLLMAPGLAGAESQPLWELGAGASVLAFPAYRGSEQTELYVLPAPYLVYRGEHVRVDRGVLRGLLFDTNRAEFDLSLNAAAPVSSDDVDAREGMPDLAAVFEVGPSLNVRLSEDREGPTWTLLLPLRAVIGIDERELRHVGWLFNPKLNFYWRQFADAWNLGFSVGPLFADRHYHNYYYGVDDRYATPTRPVYEGKAGYSGATALATLTRRFGQWWVGGFIRYDNLEGARFERSPLVETKHYLMGGVALTWVFATSSEKVGKAD